MKVSTFSVRDNTVNELDLKNNNENNNENNNDNNNDNNNESFWKKNKIILLITSVSFVLLVLLAVLLCVLLMNKKEDEIQQYYLIASYNAEKKIPLKLFNPSKIGLKDDNYTVEIINQNKNTRRLEQLNITDGVYIPETDEKIEVKITFNSALTTLDFMFEGCSSLTKVSFSGLNSPDIKSMIYTFTNCENLQTVDFTSFQTSNVEKMDFLFSGCSNLVNIHGFEDLNTNSLIKTAGMFLGCTSLVSLNLSSLNFNNISEHNGMFINNHSLELVDLGNVSDIYNLFSSSEKFHVNIITTSNYINSSGLAGTFEILNREENDNLNCSIRNYTFNYYDDFEISEEEKNYVYNYYDNFYISKLILNSTTNLNETSIDNLSELNVSLNEMEKCIECDEGDRKKYCKSCRIGYYLPKGIDFSQKRCRRCDEGCIKCIADEETDESICLECENENNNLFNNTNVYREYIIEDNYRIYFKDNYYYYNDGNYSYVNSYYVYSLNDGKCKKQCKLGKEIGCKTCNLQEGKTGQCLTCHDGYYLNENKNKTECQTIPILNCIQAENENNVVKCTKCKIDYILYNGNCIKACDIGYGCKACNQTYEYRNSCASCDSYYFLKDSDDENRKTCVSCYEEDEYCNECELVNGNFRCTKCNDYSFLLDGKCISSCSNCLNCVYENSGYVCKQCNEQYYLKTSGETKYCSYCSYKCKTCSNNGTCLNCMEGYKLRDNNICEFYCEIGNNTHCLSCDYDVKNKCKQCESGYFLPEEGTNYCYSCGANCISCYGEKFNNPVCTQCKYGYKLNNGKCVKICNLGYNWDYCKTCDAENVNYCGSCFDGYYLSNNNKNYCSYCGSYRIKKCHQNSNGDIIIDECNSDYVIARNQCVEKCENNKYWSQCLVCNEEKDKIDECKQCKSGYYLPNDLSQKSYCYSCPNTCKSCQGSYYNPTCTECKEGYKLSGGRCLKECVIGSGNLCKSCNSQEGKIDQCLECNDGYYLMTNDYDDYYYDYYDYYYYYYYYYNTKRRCRSCPDDCTKCKYNGYEADCTECYIGYHLVKYEYNQYSYYYNPINYTRCEECSIPGCESYAQNSNKCICNSCQSGLSPIKDTNTNEIISCYDGCEIGESEKCKSCNENGNCGDCNEDYELNNGKCVGDYHLYAKYKTTSENEEVKLFYSYTSVVKMKVDGVLVDNPKYYHTFNKSGEHEVYVKFSSYLSFADLFYGITHVTYIEFLPKAKDFEINYMNDCFAGCTNLEYVDLSNLVLTNNRCFMNFFSGDKNLKTVKFPSESFSNIYWFYNMFNGCE